MEWLLDMLPQKKEYVFVDSVQEYEEHIFIRGCKVIDPKEKWVIEEESYQIIPGAYVFEAMAQVGGLLLFKNQEKEEERKYNGYLYQVEKLKFHGHCQPGDIIWITSKCLERHDNLFKIKTIVEIEGKKIALGVFHYILSKRI